MTVLLRLYTVQNIRNLRLMFHNCRQSQFKKLVAEEVCVGMTHDSMSDRGEDDMSSFGKVREELEVGGVDQQLDLFEYTSPNLEIDEITDTIVRSALYNVLRLNNLELFKKWQCEYVNNPDILLKICSALPEVYEELKLKNVFLSRELEYFLEDKLISLYFNCEDNKLKDENVSKASLDDVNNRIKMTVDLVHQLKSNYIDGGKPIGQEFILVARFVSQNIHALKRQLRCTYNTIPWEEMEFCLVIFIYVNTKPLEYNIAYKLVLNTEKLLKHLCNFATKLSEETFAIADVNSKFPKETYPELSTRDSAMKSVVTKCAAFQELYDDYEQVKNVYSLKRIESSIKLALSIDLAEEEEQGKLIIERTLQVVGECLKNTLESPNVADTIHKMLLAAAPRNLRETITTLRDSLSHAHTLRKKIKLEQSNDLEFFYEVQNDLKKIETEIGIILYDRKMEILTTFLKKVIDCKNVVELKQLTDWLTVAELGEISVENMKTKELQNIKMWLEELLGILKLSSVEERHAFKEIKKVVYSEEMRLESVKRYYFKTFGDLHYFSQFLETGSLETVQNEARSHLNDINMESEIKPVMREKIITLLDDFINGFYKSAQYSGDERHKIDFLVSQIEAAVSFGSGRINAINRLKDSLEKKVSDTVRKAEEEINRMFSDIVTYLTSEDDRLKVQQEFRKKQQIYEAKLDLIELFSKLVEGSVVIDSHLEERYNDMAIFIEAKKSVINEKFQKGEWAFCKRFVNNVRSSYQTLVNSVKNAIDHEQLDDIYKAFKEFFKSFRDNGLQKKINATIEKISLSSKNQNQKYFENRLQILTRLLPVCGCNHFEIVDKYLQDRALQVAVEMLVLDLMELLHEKSLLADDRLYFDGYSPILMGQTLRNYLAHGDALVDVLPCDPAVAIVSTALKLIQHGKQLVASTTTKNLLVGRRVASNLGSLKIRYDRSSYVVSIQNEMFTEATQGHVDQVRDCICKGADIKARDVKGWTGLCFAVHGNNLESVKFFLNQRDLNIGIKDVNGQSLLHIAAISRSSNVIRYLTERKTLNIDDKDCNNLTPLHYSSENGCQDVVDILVERGADVNVTNDIGVTPLHSAAAHGHVGIVRTLLDKNADVLALSDDDLTALHAAAMFGHGNVVQVLLPRTTDVDIRSDKNNTPLVYAACKGHKSVVEILLDSGASVNASNADRLTALHLASRSGDSDTVRLLLERGAQVQDAAGDSDWTPLHCAACEGHASVIAVLLKYGAAVDSRTVFNCTALHNATSDDHCEAAVALLEGGADVNAPGPGDWTPLHFAAYCGSIKATRILLKWGARVDERCSKGLTPLHNACHRGHGDVVEALVRAGGDLYVGDKTGMSPLHYLAAFGHSDALGRALQLVASPGSADIVIDGALQRISVVDVRDECEQTPLHFAAGQGRANIVETLLQSGADVRARTKGDWTPLHFAAGNGHAETVEVLLGHGADIDARTEHDATPLHLASIAHVRVAETLMRRGADFRAIADAGWTPLHYASHNGQREIARAILRRGADVDARTENRRTALHLAAEGDFKDLVELLVKSGAGVNAFDADNHTALFLAAVRNHKDTVESLLREGAEVDWRADSDWTALHVASHEGHADVAVALLRRGADPDSRDGEGESPLHLSARNGHGRAVDALLEHGAAANVRNKYGWTPLHHAADKGHVAVALSLLDKGALVDAVGKEGRTPLHYAAAKGHVAVALSLLDKGARVDAVDKEGTTPLHYAALLGHSGVAKALLSCEKAAVDARDADDNTPLHFAAIMGRVSAVRALLDGDADVNARNEDDNTPLHFAAIKGRVSAVRALLDGDADVDARNKDGDTPLGAAARNAHPDVVSVLLDGGADVLARCGDGSVLHCAVTGDDVEVVRVVLGKIAERVGRDSRETRRHVDAVDEDGYTALACAAIVGNVDVIRLLLECGVDVDARNGSDMTALYMAANVGNSEAVKMLVDWKANANIAGPDGKTPRDVAKGNGYSEINAILKPHTKGTWRVLNICLGLLRCVKKN